MAFRGPIGPLRALGVLGLALLAAAVLRCGLPNPEVPRISIEEALELHRRSQALFVDVRTGRTWETSAVKIAGAFRQDPEKVESWAGQYAPQTALVFYCT
jgi:hypothetical protein